MPIDRIRRMQTSPYAPSRSRIRQRGSCSHPQASVIWFAIHSAVGCVVTPNRMTCRLPCPMINTIEQTERHCWHDEQIDRGDTVGMIAEERFPPLGRRSSPLGHIFSHARLSDRDVELE